MEIFQLFVLSSLVTISIIAIVNALSFPRIKIGAKLSKTKKYAGNRSYPFISILIPARDESERISQTVSHLLQQDYPSFEILILDDQSSDDTASIAIDAAGGDQRVKVISGQPLPPGWTGKNWACHQLSILARGDILVFTDADVIWEPQALSALVFSMERNHADIFTVWPTQRTQSWAERLVVPSMMFAIIAYLPELAVRFVPWPVFAAANGQCLAFRAKAYRFIGGHQIVRNCVVEDVALAKAGKRKGLKLVMALGNELISGRMYQNWKQVREGFAKNILDGHGGRPFFLILSAIFHWVLFLYPWFWLFCGWKFSDNPDWLWMALAMLSMGYGVWLLSAAVCHQCLGDVLGMPLSVVLMTIIAGQSLWWHYRYGGPVWKGRRIFTHLTINHDKSYKG